MDYEPYASYPTMQYSAFQPMPSDFTDYSPVDAVYSTEATPALDPAVGEPFPSQPYTSQCPPSYQPKDLLHWATVSCIASPSVESTVPTPSSEYQSSRPVIVAPASTHHPATSTIGYPEYDLYTGANSFASSSSHPHQHASELCYDSANTIQPAQPYDSEYWTEMEELGQYQYQDAEVAAGQALDGENTNQMPMIGESRSLPHLNTIYQAIRLFPLMPSRECA